MSDKIKVGVFFGGKSVEHEVSVISGLQAVYAFDSEKYEPVPVYITKNGEMYAGGNVGEIEAYKDIKKLLETAVRVNLIKDGNNFSLIRYPAKKFGNNVIDTIEVALPVVHGTNVEDGTLQGYLHALGIPYAGCDVFSSAVCMDKEASKLIMKAKGIPVLDCVTVNSKQYSVDGDAVLNLIEQKTKYPVIVKPVNLGSSVGIKKAKSREDLDKALDYAFGFAIVVLIENAVENLKEINCSVLGDIYDAETSVCEEPVGGDEILSYSDKYLSGGSKDSKLGAKVGGSKGSSGMADLKRKLPAEISKELEEKVRHFAKAAFQGLGCSGVTRVDFLYNTVTEELYVNELNTIPGSLSFYLWEATGKSFSTLLDDLVKLAFKREREQGELNFSFDTNILQGITLSRGGKA